MNKASKTKSFLVALLLIIGLVFLNLPNISNRIREFFYSVSSPAQEKLNNLTKQIKASWEFLNSLKEISKKNTVLQEEIKELTAKNTELKELKGENELLRSYLNLPKHQRYQVDLANIISRDFQGLEKYILLNKGASDGIEKNMPIIVSENILIGKINEVFNNYSKAILITSSNSKIPALIQESRAEGLIRGAKENMLFLELVSKDINAEENQTIITSGTGGDLPKGLLIGRISKVESPENEMFQKIEVVPATEIDRLEKVFFIKQ